jgi:hypothetical protein
MVLRLFSLLILNIALRIYASPNIGVVGLGRTIFEPLCCYACLSSLWPLQLSCTRGYHDPPQGCHASNVPYLSSLAYCMRQHCPVDSINTAQTEQCWNAVAGDGQPVTSYEDSLPSSPPATQLAYDATSLSVTSTVNETLYSDSRNTLVAYQYQESKHALYR